jgi:hypothetical protein
MSKKFFCYDKLAMKRIIRSCQLCGELKSFPSLWPMAMKVLARSAKEQLDIIIMSVFYV